MNKYSPILQDLIQAFKNLPGIGIKSAQRIVFYLLQHDHTEKAVFLSETIQKSLETIQECHICRMYSEKETCEICDDSKRDPTILCIVETPTDLIAIENTMQFKGRYFVLMGYLSPIDGIGSDELKINQLEEIFKQKVINEIILATGTMMAMARLNIPSVFVYGGTIMPGILDERELTVVDVYEAVGQYDAGKISIEELKKIEDNACPNAGSCGGMFTANTMASNLSLGT